MLDLLAVDVQTTGASPLPGSILEVGWQRLSGCGEGPLRTLHARLPEGARVPARIRRLTGIPLQRSHGLEPTPRELWWILSAAADGSRGPAVSLLAHCASFERRWLSYAAALAGAEPPRLCVCTLELARRLLPGLPSKGLRSVAGHLGASLDRYRRAADHVRATAFVWRKMVPMLKKRGVETFEDLVEFLQAPPPKPRERRITVARPSLSRLPESPGVYRLLAFDGRVLYVGKATGLRSRVRSYFAPGASGGKALALASQTASLETTVCSTPFEAALLEACEIHRHDPPYNSAMRPRQEPPRWASADLLRDYQSPAPGRLGPFPRPDLIAESGALVGSLLRLRATAGLRRVVRGRLEHRCSEVGGAALDGGVRRMARLVGDADSAEEVARALLAAGERRLAEAAEGADGEDTEEEEAESAPAPATSRDVEEVLLGMAASLARATGLGRLCSLMGSSVVSWKSPRWSGELTTDGWRPGSGWPEGVPSSIPLQLRCRLAEVAAGEVRRVLRAGGRVSVRGADGVAPDGKELRRMVCAFPIRGD